MYENRARLKQNLNKYIEKWLKTTYVNFFFQMVRVKNLTVSYQGPLGSRGGSIRLR